MMTADSSINSKFSQMSLAVAADSGWFDVQFDKAEEFDWGKNKGCKMFALDNNADSIDEFCFNLSSKSCSENNRFISQCKNNSFSSDNNLNVPIKSCYNGKKENRYSQFYSFNDSICLESKVRFI